jgi:chromosome partitioning protein
MYTLAMLGQKGGTGKTTVATALAVCAARAGLSVGLIDLDPQGSAAKWAKRRTAATPVVRARQVFELPETLALLRQGGANLAIIDTPGKIEGAAIAASRAADLALIPVRPSALDLDVLQEVRDLLTVYGNPATYVVLNAVPVHGRHHEEARTVIVQRYGLPVLSAHLCQRVAYAAAMISGQTASEYEPHGKAAQEIDALYALLCSVSQPLNMKNAYEQT